MTPQDYRDQLDANLTPGTVALYQGVVHAMMQSLEDRISYEMFVVQADWTGAQIRQAEVNALEQLIDQP